MDNSIDATTINSRVFIIAVIINIITVIAENVNIVVKTIRSPENFVGGSISLSFEIMLPMNMTGWILSGTSPIIISIITEITIIDIMYIKVSDIINVIFDFLNIKIFSIILLNEIVRHILQV